MSRVPTNRYSWHRKAFVLTPEYLKKLDNAFDKFGTPATYYVKMADGLERKLDLKRLQELENSSNRQIEAISIRGERQDAREDRQAEVTFQREHPNTLRILLNGPEAEVCKLNDAIDEYLNGMTPWYSIISSSRPSIMMFPALLLPVVLIIFFAASRGAFDFLAHDRPEDPVARVRQSAWEGFIVMTVSAGS